MKHAIALMWALCLLLTGCSVVTTATEYDNVEIVPQASSNRLQMYPSPESLKTEASIGGVPVVQWIESADSSGSSIVKTLSGEGIDQIDIYAELCGVVVEQSTGDNIEAVFSFPEIAKPNYDNHFQLGTTRNGSVVSISTDYQDRRWDTAFDSISGFDGNRYRETALLTIRLPQRQYKEISLQLVSAGNTLVLSDVDTQALNIRISTGDVIIQTDREYENLSISHKVGNVTLQTPALSEKLNISSTIGVFTLSLPSEPPDMILEIRYDEEAVAAGDEAVYILPITWDAKVSEDTVRCVRGVGGRQILVENQKYGVFAVEIDGIASSEPLSAR